MYEHQSLQREMKTSWHLDQQRRHHSGWRTDEEELSPDRPIFFRPPAPLGPHLLSEEEDGAVRFSIMLEVTVGFPVQETSSDVDSGHFPPLSEEETPNHSLSQGNSSTSTETFKGEHITINKTQETNKDFTLNGNCFTESGYKDDVASKPNDNIRGNHGGNDSRADDYTNIDIYTAATSSKLQDGANIDKNNSIELENTSTDHGRNDDDSSCFRPTTEETEVKKGYGKVFDGNNPNEKSSTGLEHDSLVKEATRPGNYTTTVLKSEDSVKANSEENNITLESQRSDNSPTEVVIESGPKDDVASKPNDYICGHHGGNDSIADDCANIDIYTAATSSKLQGEGDMAKNNTIELENKTSTDLGRNNGDSSCFSPTTEETDVNEGNGKAFDVTSPTVKSSTGLEQHSIVIEVIRKGNSPTPVLKSEDCARANSAENNLTLKRHRSDNSATKIFESGHNADVDYQNNGEIFAHHDVTSSISGGGQTGGDACNSRIDNGIPCCTLQDGANTAKMTTDNGGGNNDYLYYGPNINETDVKEGRNKSLDGNIPNNDSSTGCEQDINVIREDNQTNVYYNQIISKSEDSSTVSPDINNTATKAFESGHHLDVGYRPDEIFGLKKVKNNFSATSQTGGNVSRIDDNMFINTCNTSKCFKQQGGAKMDKYNPIDSEIKTDQGADNNTLSCHKSNIKETDVKEVKSETFNGSCLNDKSSTGLQHNNNVPEVTRPYDDMAMIMESRDGSTTGSEENNLVLEGDRSSTCADKVCESEDNGDESCRHNGEIFAYRKVKPSLSKASQTGENASSFRIYGGTHIDGHCTAVCCKAEQDQNNGIDLENKIPRDYGGGNIDLSYCRQTINDPDIRYDNSSADSLQDPTEVIKSDDQTTVIPNLANSDTEDCEKNNPTLVQNGSDSTTKVFGPNDGACQIGGKTSTDLRPGIFRINDGTNRVTYKRGRRKDRKLDDKIFSSHRRDNNHLSRQRPKSQHQSRDSLTPANSTDVQQDGTDSAITSTGDHVSLGCRSLICNPLETKTDKQNPSKPSSGVYKPWNVFWTTLLCTCIFWMMTTIAGAAAVQAFRVPPQMRSYHFCADESLFGQIPTIRHMDDPTAVNCTFNFTSAGFFRNCLESGCLIFGKNETCLEMLTSNLNTTDYCMEYRITGNGDHPKAHSVLGAPGDPLIAAEVMAKIAEYNKPLKNTTQAPLYGHNNTTQQKEDNNSQTVGIVVGVLVAAGLCVAVLLLLWKNWSKLKRWVNSCRRRNPNRASNTDNHECGIPLKEMPNGHVNGRVPNEENQDPDLRRCFPLPSTSQTSQ